MSDFVEGIIWPDGVADPLERVTTEGVEVDVFIWRVESDQPCVVCLSHNGQRIELPASPTALINWGVAKAAFEWYRPHANCSCTLDYIGRETQGTLAFLSRTLKDERDRVEEVGTGELIVPGGSRTYSSADMLGGTWTVTAGGEIVGLVGGGAVPGSVSGKGVYSESVAASNSGTRTESELLANPGPGYQEVIERWRTITTEYEDRYKDEHEQEVLFRSLKIETIFLGHIAQDVDTPHADEDGIE